jgi:hypothetical protein
VSSAAALIKRLKALSEPISDPLVLDFIAAGNPGGWLKRLGEYRDLVIHGAPLANAAGSLFVMADQIAMRKQPDLSIIFCPLPDDPGELLAKRSHSLRNGMERAFASSHASRIDGLQYSHACLTQLARLASVTARRSPIPPKMLVLTPHEGTVRREGDRIIFTVKQTG